jgi:peptide/nickel transport system permease protein
MSWRFWLRKLGSLLAVLFAISVLVFVIFNVIPGGDPALRMAGRHPNPENVAQIRKDWGFDKPLYVQYGEMMNHLFISRDLISYQDRTEVLPTIRRAIPKTLSLALGAAVIWLFFGVLLGVISGLRRGRWQDSGLTVLAMAGVSIPVFWLGAVLLYLLTYKWHSFPLFSWIPSGGYVPLSDPIGWASHLFLPWICLSTISIGFYSRVVRSSLITTQSADSVRTANAMGLSRRRVLWNHTLRLSLLPIVSLFALDLGAAIGGTVILVEPVFGINGVGAYAQQAVAHLDLPPLMALTMYGGFLIVLINTFADVLSMILDPRIRRD